MSYVRAHKVDIEESDGSRDGAVHLELPDHDKVEERPALDLNMDDEILDFVLRLISEVNELSEGEALVVWKVIM